jgi:hypothetical protein
VLVQQDKVEEALKAYRDSLSIAERLVASDRSNTKWQHDFQTCTDKISNLAYGSVLARNFGTALEAADLVVSVAPNDIRLQVNRAHALMFLNRVEEAREVYLRYRGEWIVQHGKPWEAVILEDFAEMRKAELTHPLMDEIEKRFAAGDEMRK